MDGRSIGVIGACLLLGVIAVAGSAGVAAADTDAVPEGDRETAAVGDPESDPGTELDELPGNGTADDPYVITDVAALQAMNRNLSAHYALGSDIDASTTADWNDGSGFEPIGRFDADDPTASFTGRFDGNGHTIANLTIDRPDDRAVGLFGSVREDADGNSNVGWGIPREQSVIEDVHLENVDVRGGELVGGIAGVVSGQVSGVSVSGTVAGRTHVGGAVGYSQVRVTETAATVDVEGGLAVGGLIGTTFGAVVTESYATGDVRGIDGPFDDRQLGGLVGKHGSGTISDAFATGAVTGDEDVGGLVGYARPWSTVETSYAAGPVRGDGDVGGLIGRTGSEITDANATVESAYWDIETTGQTESAAGTGLTHDNLTGPAVSTHLTGFDSARTWIATDEYPWLEWSVADAQLQIEESLEPGDRTRASVTVRRVDGERAPATAVATYGTSNESVVTIDGNGSIEAVENGTARIEASVGGRAASAVVAVERPSSPTATEAEGADGLAGFGTAVAVFAILLAAGVRTVDRLRRR